MVADPSEAGRAMRVVIVGVRHDSMEDPVTPSADFGVAVAEQGRFTGFRSCRAAVPRRPSPLRRSRVFDSGV